MLGEHLETSGVEEGNSSMMVVQYLPAELEAATVARETQHVRWALRHQPAGSYPAYVTG